MRATSFFVRLRMLRSTCFLACLPAWLLMPTSDAFAQREQMSLPEQPGYVVLNFEIEEGALIHIGHIAVRGNQNTKDKVARRELRFFPGEVFNTTKIKEARQRLIETRLFEEATTITPVGDEPGVRDVLVEVREAQSTFFLVGVGVTSDAGVLGNLTLENRNFDIGDWPRDFGELFTFRSFRGAGQTARLELEPGTELTRFRLQFHEPYLLDQPLSLGTSLYLFQRGRDAYTEQRMGTNVSFGRRFQEGPLAGWAGEVALRNEWIRIFDIDDPRWARADEVLEASGTNYLISVKGTILRDRTDSRFFPTRGDRLRFSWEQASGDFNFAKALASYTWHKTLRTDMFERKSVLSMHADTGYIFGDAPLFERFYAGGIGSMRGFDYRGVSPRGGFGDDRVGGDFMILTGAEYSFPVWGKTLRGVVFADMGTVEEDFEITEWRASLGVGARILVRFFGPVPLAFDFGVPIAKGGEDDTRIFSFSFGASF